MGIFIHKPCIRDCFRNYLNYKVQEIAFTTLSEINKDRTKTDTGGLVEYTKALERTILKELGKMTP